MEKIGLRLNAIYRNAVVLFATAIFALLVWLKKWGVWVFMTQFVPGSDQLDVMSSAYMLRHGDYNVMGFQLVNCFGLVLVRLSAIISLFAMIA